MPKRLNRDQFIEKSIKVHNFKYSYNDVIYKNNRSKVDISCPLHGIFKQLPQNHLNGFGCPECSNNLKLTNEFFIKKSIEIHRNRYKYDLVNISNNSSKVIIECVIHGKFEQSPSSHLSGHGCSKCYGNSRSSTEDFILKSKLIHGDVFNYDSVKYNNTNKKVEIECKLHGIFDQTPHSHLSGKGCPNCRTSKGEVKIQKILDDKKIKYKKQYYFSDLKDISLLYFDFAIFDHTNKLIFLVEYNGIQHYQFTKIFHRSEDNFVKSNNRDGMKIKYCLENKIPLYIIKYNENIYNRVCNLIKTYLI